MNVIIVYCGNILWCPVNVEILGDIRFTDTQMSTIGKELQPYQRGNEIRRVFTNNENVVHGIQVSVKRKTLHHKSVIFQFMVDHGCSYKIELDADGNFLDYPPGFFEQTRLDLLELF